MTKEAGSQFLPGRLPAVSDRWNRWLRPVWFLALTFAILWTIAGSAFAFRDAFYYDVPFARAGLTTRLEQDGTVSVQSMTDAEGLSAEVAPQSYIIAIDGQPIAHETRFWTLSERLRRPVGMPVSLSVESPDGVRQDLVIPTSDSYRASLDKASPVSRGTRFAVRLTTSLLTCLTLIASGVLLYMRRPRDPVALLFSFSFLLYAGVIDPPLQLWVASGLGRPLEAISAVAWTMLILGIATFPDGRFVPKFMRWLLIVVPLLAIPQAIREVPELLSAVIGYVLPGVLLLSQIYRYRQYKGGLERQQIKWAAYGFATGLAFLATVYITFPLLSPVDPNYPFYGMGLVLLFNFGYIAIAAGLLVSLIRFRLWEADRVISRSAIAAAITLAVGVLWALGMDMVKTLVEEAFGDDSELLGTAAGALLAAGIFAPTQALAQKWATRRLDRELNQARKLVDRLAVWRTSEAPEEIGQRALSSIASATHCGSAAILVDTPRGQVVLASRDIADPDALAAAGQHPETDGSFPIALPLEDEDGPVGWLLAGPRSDQNRYNSQEIESFALVTEPLAEALRTSRKRAHEKESMQALLGTVEERLARLEEGPARPSPA
ncbi:hypothetical protein GRI89_17540 [Altererythrobacter salegens]|uniref:GAF domain-containing protein n=1 Tax=Croceibacterium salegens TaxID=1737568 RepID=A0A6I4T185_9SPHN|nr:hypothetical protein [Croceibacterium salegens]MXO61349.1 hypothetical protein [Croceibacterium salegens]